MWGASFDFREEHDLSSIAMGRKTEQNCLDLGLVDVEVGGSLQKFSSDGFYFLGDAGS